MGGLEYLPIGIPCDELESTPVPLLLSDDSGGTDRIFFSLASPLPGLLAGESNLPVWLAALSPLNEE